MKTLNFRYSLVSATIACCLWGGWAFYVNYFINPARGYIAGLVQGGTSFILTLLMIRILTYFYSRSPQKLRFFLPAMVTVTLTGSLLYAVHALAQTPNIFKTILPPMSVALSFCLVTSYKLNNINKILRIK